MENVSVIHAKDHPEELIERAAKGEDIRRGCQAWDGSTDARRRL